MKLRFKISVFALILFTFSNSSKSFAQDNKFYSRINKIINSQYNISLASQIGSSFDTQMKINIDKKINDKLSISGGYINHLSTYDFSLKTTVLKNKFNAFKYPLNLYYRTNFSNQSNREIIFDKKDRFSFLHQLNLVYQLKSSTEIIFSPTYIHQNLVKTKIKPEKGMYPWDSYFLGLSIKRKVYENTTISGTYYNQISKKEVTDFVLKTGYKFNLKQNRGLRSYGISISNLGSLSNIGLLTDMGMKNSTSLKVGIHINQQLEIKNK
jgi:hypothetical protein